MDRGAQWATVHGVANELDTTEANGCLGRPYKQLRKEEKRKAREKRKDTPI